jgi:hypothetical protein
MFGRFVSDQPPATILPRGSGITANHENQYFEKQEQQHNNT